MSPVWVHSIGDTHKLFSVAVLLSQPQERIMCQSYGFRSHWHVSVLKELDCNRLIKAGVQNKNRRIRWIEDGILKKNKKNLDLESRPRKRKLKSNGQRVRVPEGRKVMETKEESNFKKESVANGDLKITWPIRFLLSLLKIPSSTMVGNKE